MLRIAKRHVMFFGVIYTLLLVILNHRVELQYGKNSRKYFIQKGSRFETIFSNSEASLRIAEDGFLCMAEFWASKFLHSSIQLVTLWRYPYIKKNIIIPPEKILEFIGY